MKKIVWNDNWQVKQITGQYDEQKETEYITLPHDAMIGTKRRKDAFNGTKKAFFQNGVWEYKKEFEVPDYWRDIPILLEFEGVYMNAMVYINGSFAGKHCYGYTEFSLSIGKFLNFGERNEIKVTVKTGDDSRWYSGAGIYRNVNLLLGAPVYVVNQGVWISVPHIRKERAEIVIRTEVCNACISPVTARVKNEIYNSCGQKITEVVSPLTLDDGEMGKVHQRLFVENPSLWDIEHPERYLCRSTLILDDEMKDVVENRFGIRELYLDAEDGMILNGNPIKLRGACIHHDHGIIGARSYYEAEYRRVKKLKEAGFNAIRMAHHPAGRALLDACDRLGVLVMDECFDMWNKNKSSDDYALHFAECWEQDVEAMVRKDFNHPCVIMYSIGNEIPDISTSLGTRTGRKITDKLRALDGTRLTVNAVNGILAIMDKEGEINAAMSEMEMEGRIAAAVNSLLMDKTIEEACSQVDIAGYNYMKDRYETDAKKYPQRIIVGSETYPKDICKNWRLVQKLHNVIGDFTWVGWDYLGETGLGKFVYDEQLNEYEGSYGKFPYITACCGDRDITGFRLPVSYYREIVFGLRKEPYIAVSRPEMSGKKHFVSIWGWPDVISCWSFPGYEGTEVKVEVYTDSEEIELYLNGVRLGRKAVRAEDECKAVFIAEYQPGILEAVGYRRGEESGRYALHTAGSEKRLQIAAEDWRESVRHPELVFINLSFTDLEGIILVQENHAIELEIDGDAELLGFGNGAYQTEEGYTSFVHTSHDGRAFAVVRRKSSEAFTVTARAEGFDDAVCHIKEQREEEK